jgi:PiT family inorganic phosphate transporter
VETLGLVVLIAVALGFDFTNGFNDAANAIAMPVSTRALSPRVALGLAAVFNLLGALVSTKVADTVGGIISTPRTTEGLVVVFAAVAGAIVWNIVVWRFGLPSSSTHALIGGLCGAAIASSGTVNWHAVVRKVIIPMVASPLVGFTLGFAFMLLLLWVFRRANPRDASVGFRIGQWFGSCSMAFGHGLQDAQKTMGVITLALLVTHHVSSFVVPLWVKLACAFAISAGTATGGTRIMRTLGRRVFKLDNTAGFAAQSVASAVLLTTAYAYAAPVSTTHITTSAVMGVGSTRKISAVRWGVAGNIVAAWVLTLPSAGLMAAGIFELVHLFVN